MLFCAAGMSLFYIGSQRIYREKCPTQLGTVGRLPAKPGVFNASITTPTSVF